MLYLVVAGVVRRLGAVHQVAAPAGRDRAKLAPADAIVLENKYCFDWFNENVLAPAAALLGKLFWKVGDQGIIDGVAVNGSASAIGFIAGVVRRVQSGFSIPTLSGWSSASPSMLGWFLTRI